MCAAVSRVNAAANAFQLCRDKPPFQCVRELHCDDRLSDVETNFLSCYSAGAAERVPRQHDREAPGAALQLGSLLADDVMRRRHLLGVVYRNILHHSLTAGHARHVTSGRRRVSMAARPGGGSVRVAPCMMHGWREGSALIWPLAAQWTAWKPVKAKSLAASSAITCLCGGIILLDSGRLQQLTGGQLLLCGSVRKQSAADVTSSPVLAAAATLRNGTAGNGAAATCETKLRVHVINLVGCQACGKSSFTRILPFVLAFPAN